MAMMKDDISHEEYRSKLANVADLAVSYINTGNGYFRMRDAFNGLAEQCGANKGINDEATVGRRKLLAQSVCIECISSSQKVGDNRIITLHSLSGWYVDGRFVKNGFSLKRNADGSAIVHTEVPQARVFVTTTEDDTKSDKEDGHFSNGISDTDNKGNSSTADISSSLNSASSNDNGSVGKIGTNGNLSDAITGGISPQQNYSRQSVGNPSSQQEADAKENEGEHNTYPQHQFGGQTQRSNGSNANGYKPNEYHNGNQ